MKAKKPRSVPLDLRLLAKEVRLELKRCLDSRKRIQHNIRVHLKNNYFFLSGPSTYYEINEHVLRVLNGIVARSRYLAPKKKKKKTKK